MLKKTLYFALICFTSLVFVSCTSKPTPAATVRDYKPVIEITFTESGACIVSCSYVGKDWLFIKGVEIMNGAGDTRKCIFKNVNRHVARGLVSESGVFSVAFSDSFREWLGDSASARALCDYPQEFKLITIIRK